MHRCRYVAGLLALALLANGAKAASISYLLDQTDADPFMRDGHPYVQVTVTDGAAGAIDFTISILPALTGIGGDGFGLEGFAFNAPGAAGPLFPANVIGLPAGWSLSFGSPAGGFGRFDLVLDGAAATVPAGSGLTFSIAGISNDAIGDYAVLSGGKAVQGHAYFAARVAGFLDQHPGSKDLTDAWFGGSRAVMQAVPLPGAGWLLLPAIAWLGALRRQSPR